MTSATNRIMGYDFPKSLAQNSNFFAFSLLLISVTKPKYLKLSVGFNADFSGCIVKPNDYGIIFV